MNNSLPCNDKHTPRAPIQSINGLHTLARDYDVFLFDIFGVLHNGVQLYDGTLNCLQQLREHRKSIGLISNTPRCKDGVKEDLEALGLQNHLYDDIFTAGESARQELISVLDQNSGKQTQCFFMGNENFKAIVDGLDVILTHDITQADIVVNALPSLANEFDEEITDILKQARKYNIPMICANPDLVVDIAGTLKYCSGTFADQYEKMGGTVTYHGKPHAQIYDEAWERFSTPEKKRVLAIGDSIRTDISGGKKFGFDVIWNIAGIHREEIKIVIKNHSEADTIDSGVLKHFINNYDQNAPLPDYVLKELKW